MTQIIRTVAIAVFAAAVAAAIPGVVWAQAGPGGPPGLEQDRRPPGPGPGPGGRMGMGGPGDEAMGRFFFPPHQVLEHADEIGLQPDQRQAVEELLTASEARFREARYRLGNEMTKIAALAVDTPIDEAAITAQLDRVLELESQIKREQLLMLVRVKNLLTGEQQAALAATRRDPGPPARRQDR